MFAYSHYQRHGGELYGGPQEFVETGSRGFLISTLPGKEEFAVDDTILLLRQASIKLHGAVKVNPKKVPLSSRYVSIDFMDPKNVQLWPTPEEEKGEEDDEEEKEKITNEEALTSEDAKDEKSSEVNLADSKTDEEATEKTNESQEESVAEKNSNDSPEDEKKPFEQNEDIKESDESKNKDSTQEQAKKAESGSEIKPPTNARIKKVFPVMRSIYKFKGFRTETRNVMFIKTDVPDILALAEAAMQLLFERKKVYEDGACQLLPVIGVCNFDFVQLEIMSRRVLSSLFSLSEDPKSFSVLVLDNLPGPNAETVMEIVRSTIWSLNPFSWQASALTEPDVLIQVDLVGCKLIMCCVTKYMYYRYYSPNLLVKGGYGEPEEDDGSWLTPEEKKHQEQLKLAREKEKELQRQRQEAFKKERERKRIQLEERRKLKSREAENRDGKSQSKEKPEGPNKNESSEVKGDSPPSKKQKLDSAQEASGEQSKNTKGESGLSDKEESQLSPPDADMNAEDEDNEKLDTPAVGAKEKVKRNKKRARGSRGRNRARK
ncbi:hypothetical protein Btru_067546 [Bulinus truncatus]|nr:hypothetical protein Btru_067546 [Bulinus truncatus]